MTKILFLTIVSMSILSMVTKAQEIKMPYDNPLMRKSDLQYQAPIFDKIKDEHFKPAFEVGMQLQNRDLERLADSKLPPTFENTVLVLENSGELLGRATGIFYNLTGSNTNPTLQAIEEEYAPKFSAHNDKIYLNSKLYNRVKAIDLNSL